MLSTYIKSHQNAVGWVRIKKSEALGTNPKLSSCYTKGQSPRKRLWEWEQSHLLWHRRNGWDIYIYICM